MARRAHAYPQVDSRAVGLVDLRVQPCPAGASAGRALGILRKRGGQALVLPGLTGIALLQDLARAVALGLSELPAADLRRVVPVVRASEPEISVRRHLLAGAPAVLVTDRLEAIGAVSRSTVRGGGMGASLLARLGARVPADVLGLLGEVGRLAGATGSGAFAVGGVVRDALIDRPGARREREPRRDLDVVIEGDGIALARRVARTFGGTLTVHEAFGTATLEGLHAGRLDIATARAERYAAPGALPTVRRGTIADDLERRDFAVNAMAVELSSGAFGLVDPLAGREDVARRRIRVLHPLSFVEDPTRILRAARYATRLGFALDRGSLRAQALALRLVPYRALSAQRIAAEIERTLDDSAPGAALARAGASGAFRLLHPRFRFRRSTAGRLAALDAALGWMRGRALGATALELAALAVAGDQPDDVAAAALRALAFSGEPLARLLRAHASVPALAGRLAAMSAAPASERAALLRERPAIDLAWAWLSGDSATRARIDWYLDSASGVRGALRGTDLVRLGVPRGPALGLVLGRLRDARIDGRARSREDEIALVHRWRSDIVDRSATREEG